LRRAGKSVTVRSSAICDANIAVRWLVDHPTSGFAIEAREAHDLIAPQLLLAEVANALRGYVRAGLLPLEMAQTHLVRLPRQIELRPEDSLMPLALRLSIEHAHPVYDCVYVAMALTLNCPLVTADGKLAKAFAGLRGLQLQQPLEAL